MLLPAAEAPVLALQVGGNIGRHQRRFHQKSTRTAHRIGQRTASLGQRRPARTDQNGRRQVLLERRRTLLKTVAALVQTGTRQVQRQLNFATVTMDVDAQIRPYLIHPRTGTVRATQLVDDRILDLERTEVRVVYPGQSAGKINRQGAIHRQVIAPVDKLHAGIQVLGRAGQKALEHQQYPVAQARPQTQAVTEFDIALH